MVKCSGCVLCSRWRNFVAWVMVCVTMGAWMPYLPPKDAEDLAEDDEFSIPPPLHEGHQPPAWKMVAEHGPEAPVSLVKPPKNPATDPTHAKPTPKVPVKMPPVKAPSPKPVVRPKTPPPPNQSAVLVAFLRAQLGKPYVLGGNGPEVYDCSGLTKNAFAHIGIHLPRTSEQQSTRGVYVSLYNLQVGDLLFWGAPGIAYHVAVYIGNGRYIAAQNPAVGVVERTLAFSPANFARRIL